MEVVKRTIAFFLTLCCCASLFAARGKTTPPGWFDDYEAAKEKARKENKPMLILFTGSDWCPWCIRLHDEVFIQKPFLDYAARHLVLLTVDFPRKKWQTPQQKRENEDLARRYGIRGYPTVLLLDPDGRVIGQTGSRKGGPIP